MTRNAPERETPVIQGPAGNLQAVHEYRRGTAPRAVAVVCHPHPQYGGTLDNKVAFSLARAAMDAGAAALRFNFRGVGRSEGRFDDGKGEADDLAAAEDWLAGRWPDAPLWRMGFSFGAAMALKRTLAVPCPVLVTVAPPADRFAAYGFAGAGPRASHWLLVQGDADEVVSPRAVFDWAEALESPPEIRRIEGSGHFFHGRLTELRETVVDFLNAIEETR